MRTLIMMVGIPGSGKSYFAKEMTMYDKLDNNNVAIISRDDIRKNLIGQSDDYFSKENEVFREFVDDINRCLEVGVDRIYVDATHINRASRSKLLRKLALEGTEVRLVVVVMDTPLELCKKRNSRRFGFSRVPDKAIEDMFKRYEVPTEEEFDRYNFSSVTIIFNKAGNK